MTIILYTMPLSPPGRAVQLLAEILGLPLNIQTINLVTGEQLSPEFVKINPQHTLPTINDDGVILWESHAIMAYLVGKYGKDDSLYPKDLSERAIVDQRLHFDSMNLFGALRNIVRGIKIRGNKGLSDHDKNDIYEAYDFLEKFLNGKKWMAGDSLTIADISLVATSSSLNTIIPIEGGKFPNLDRWLKQCQAMPWYKINEPGLVDFKNHLNDLLTA